MEVPLSKRRFFQTTEIPRLRKALQGERVQDARIGILPRKQRALWRKDLQPLPRKDLLEPAPGQKPREIRRTEEPPSVEQVSFQEVLPDLGLFPTRPILHRRAFSSLLS